MSTVGRVSARVRPNGPTATGRHLRGHEACTTRPGVSIACPADTRPDDAGERRIVGRNLGKAVSVLATLLAGTGSALLAPAGAQAGAGAELKVSASDDAYTSSGRRGANFGREDKLVVGRLAGDTKVSFLKFVVPAGADVTGARLRLTPIGAFAGTVTVSRVAGNAWTENTLTSGNAPKVGMPVASARPRATDRQLVFDLGAEVTGPGAYSLAVRSSAAGTVIRFRSAEGRFGGPELTVRTAATPGTPVQQPAAAETGTPPGHTPPADSVPGGEPAAQPAAPTQPPASAGTGTPAPAETPAPAGTATPAPAETGTPAAPTETTTPTAPASGTDCVTGALLVPSCGVLWGGAAGGFTDAPRDAALKDWEKLSGRTATIFHTYHKGDEPFPTRSEIAMARDAAHPRVLLLNWKIAYGTSWAEVAAGRQDARIDAFAARVRATFPEKFFLVLNHEPENDVNPKAGSGWEAKDFAAMYRHTVQRLRAKGVTNAINVLAYMGNEKWMSQSWWKDLYPGDDVVDWIGLDSYVSAEKGYYHYGMFADLLDRAGTDGTGFYDWAVTRHRGKPLMVAEWGVYHRVGKPADKAPGYASVLPELAKRPAIKAIVYFDTAHDDQGDRDISIDSTRSSLAAFRTLAASPVFDVELR
jgi:Glycosyl hydrolase family 26